MKSSLLILLLVLGCTLMAQEAYTAPSYSQDGEKILFSKPGYEGLYCAFTANRSMQEITDAPGAGYKANWSSDGSRIAFKMLDPEKGQAPVLFEVASQKLIYLAPFSARCGVPFFAQDGKISFSLDDEIMVLNPDLSLSQRIPIGFYANLCVISPNGQWLAHNDENDSIWLISLTTGLKSQATTDGQSYFSPIFSPDSTKLLVSTLKGHLKVITLSNLTMTYLDEGENPIWTPDGTIVYSQKIIQQGELLSRSLYEIECSRAEKKTLLEKSFFAHVAYDPKSQSLLLCDEKDGKIYLGSPSALRSSSLETVAFSAPTRVAITETAPVLTIVKAMREETRNAISGVPYIHQVYDTPNWFNGNWACGATSATMALTYYKLLAHWDCTVSVPYSHVSHFGRYICEKYTYGGYTFNSMTTDASGKAAYGGYGYICRNDWADTKGYMAEYLRKHGVGSSVDWSPSWAELQGEVNAGHPMVILNSLTGPGHYILGIGYYNAQHTVIVNDPYGNKNQGYMNYKGAGVSYDWPGYNNGFQNLNGVHCFIYARK